MGYLVDNAIIMAAGTSSRFAPLSYERPKALIEVRGEILIERQIRQLKEVGIKEIYIVVGYKKEQFKYLVNKFGVTLIENDDFLTRNNHSSIYAARNVIRNSYICSADNYFLENPFEIEVEGAYYAALYSEMYTNEWCMSEDDKGYISKVVIGGQKSWYMLGHVFWDEKFSRQFISILEKKYDDESTYDLLWENIFINNTDTLKMKIRKYDKDFIFEFDTLDELRQFDETYILDSHSVILNKISKQLNCEEKNIVNIKATKSNSNEASGFIFDCLGKKYEYNYKEKVAIEIQ